MKTWLIAVFTGSLLFIPTAIPESGVREVEATSCEVIKVNLGLGITTQIVLEQQPKTTLYADKSHFKVQSNEGTPRSLAVIPYIQSSEVNTFRKSNGELPSPEKLANALNESFRTNLFVFFENENQLMFELQFVPKAKADYILKVRQKFSKECSL